MLIDLTSSFNQNIKFLMFRLILLAFAIVFQSLEQFSVTGCNDKTGIRIFLTQLACCPIVA
jgi:hypothetical protein